ncbi:MAG: glycine--tRNA ligase subunit beta, partial [Rhodobacterales bacterium CG_4_9_14_3_um_filter_71_31]
IGAQFLDLPPEVLRTSMKTHQKFFSVRNPATGRIEKFVTVANIEAPDHGATILNGNRRVLTARLSDAKFFWENDLRTSLDAMREKLRAVTFHNKLGSQFDRIERIAALAREIAPKVAADPEMAERAARLAKADLASAMVGEFPELQGVMGRYYALAAGEAPEVAAACAEHYAPLGPSDGVPTAPVSVAVALADKIDMLAGFWAINEKPTGSKDPFALRRAALGVVRSILHNDLRVQIQNQLRPAFISAFQIIIIKSTMNEFSENLEFINRNLNFEQLDEAIRRRAMEKCERLSVQEAPQLAFDLLAFLHDRLRVHLRERGIRHDVIDACLTPDADDLTLLVARIEALQAF